MCGQDRDIYKDRKQNRAGGEKDTEGKQRVTAHGHAVSFGVTKMLYN